MKNENAESLIAKFPRLYRKVKSAGSIVPMGFGFECGDGWVDILCDLSAAIEARAAAAGLDRDSAKWPAADQVKEKFGELRYYLTTPEGLDVGDLVAEAWKKSSVTCEHCGEPGRMRDGVWLSTVCDSCHAKRIL